MMVLKSVDGVYRDDRIEISALPQGVLDGTPVIVTFLHMERATGREVAGPWQAPLTQRGRPMFARGWYRAELDADQERRSSTLLMW